MIYIVLYIPLIKEGCDFLGMLLMLLCCLCLWRRTFCIGYVVGFWRKHFGRRDEGGRGEFGGWMGGGIMFKLLLLFVVE